MESSETEFNIEKKWPKGINLEEWDLLYRKLLRRMELKRLGPSFEFLVCDDSGAVDSLVETLVKDARERGTRMEIIDAGKFVAEDDFELLFALARFFSSGRQRMRSLIQNYPETLRVRSGLNRYLDNPEIQDIPPKVIVVKNMDALLNVESESEHQKKSRLVSRFYLGRDELSELILATVIFCVSRRGRQAFNKLAPDMGPEMMSSFLTPLDTAP